MINVMSRVYDPIRGQFFQLQQNNEVQSNKGESGNKGSNTSKGSGGAGDGDGDGDGDKGSGGNSGGGDKVDTELTLKDLLDLLRDLYNELRLRYPDINITFGNIVRLIRSDIHNPRYAQIVKTGVRPGRNHGVWLLPYNRIIEL